MAPERDTTDVEHGESLSPAETRHALWVAAVAWGVFGSAWASLITGAPFVNFARTLGASTFMFGLLSSLPFLGVLAQLPSAYFVERLRRRKKLFLIAGSGQRLVWLLVAALPWAIPPQHDHARVAALLVLVMLSSTLGHLGSPGWMSWFADFVPVEIRGRYLGNRAALATCTAVVVSGAVGWVLDRNSTFPVFTTIFAVAAVLGMGDILLFLFVRETTMDRHEGPPWRLRNVISTPLADAPFRRYLLYALSEAFVFGVAGPFFWLMGLEVLEIGNFWSNFYIMIVPMVFTAVTLPLWGGLCDRFGVKPLVTLGMLSGVTFPAFWVLATKSHYHLLLGAAAVIGGSFGSAVQAADMSMIFGLTPRRNRSAFLAMVALAASLGWVVAPSMGGAVAQVLKPVELRLLGRTFGNLHFLMAISFALRFLHVIFVVPRLPEEPKQTTGALVRHLVRGPFAGAARVFGRRRDRGGGSRGQGKSGDGRGAGRGRSGSEE